MNARIHVRPGVQGVGPDDGEGQHDDAGVADDRVAEDVLEVVLDEGGDRGQHDRGDRDGEDDVAFRVRSTGSGATVDAIQARATTASDAGANAVRTGSAVSGTTSVRRAAQRWNGIAPKRIATATAKAR